MSPWADMDWTLFMAMIALVILGLIMIFSASALSAYQMVGSIQYFFRRQLIWSLLGLIACGTAYYVPITYVKRLTPVLYALTLCLLGLVLIPWIGREAGGARRWIDLGIVGFQPSELAKLAVILMSALYLSGADLKKSRMTKHIFLVSLITLAMVALVALEPDIGTSFQIALMGFLMLFLAGFPIRYLMFLVLMAVPFGAITIFSSGYRRARVLAYLDPWSDPLDRGYHTIQSLKALSHGGFAGVGLGGSIHKMGYLPEPFTDSIVAILGEELGFLGVLLLISLIGYLVLKGFLIGIRASDPFERMTGVGVAALIGLQAALNLSVVSGLIPTTGVSMPFISYGGSSLLVNMTGVGILLNISGGNHS